MNMERGQDRDLHISFRPMGSMVNVDVPASIRNKLSPYRRMEVNSYSCPVSYMTTPELSITLVESGNTYAVTISAGSYSIGTWISELDSKLTAAGSSVYSTTYNTTTGTITVQTDPPVAFTLGFTAAANPRKLRYVEAVLGVLPDTPSPQLNALSGSVTSVAPVRLYGPETLYITSTALARLGPKKNSSIGTDIDSGIAEAPDDLLFAFTPAVEPGNEDITQLDLDYQASGGRGVFPTSIDLSLLDPYGSHVDLRGAEFRVLLRFM